MITLVAILLRLIPHPPNMAPITALALFSGVYLHKKAGWIVPLVAMLLSDYLLNFHSVIFFVYISFLIIFILGTLIKRIAFLHLVVTSLISSTIFFLVTNFGVWLMTDMYTKSWHGLMTSYMMGIPFFRNTVIGDFAYILLFFYGYRFILLVVEKFLVKKRYLVNN